MWTDDPGAVDPATAWGVDTLIEGLVMHTIAVERLVQAVETDLTGAS